MTVGEFAERVAMLALMFGLSETSGGRSAAHNAEVGGVEWSAHRFFLGRDLIADGPRDVGPVLEAGRRLGLKVIVEVDHYHIQPADWIQG